jgi:hypothetical protein
MDRVMASWIFSIILAQFLGPISSLANNTIIAAVLMVGKRSLVRTIYVHVQIATYNTTSLFLSKPSAQRLILHDTIPMS